MKIELNIERDTVKETAKWAALFAKATIVGGGVGLIDGIIFRKHWKAMYLPLYLTTAALTMTPRDTEALCDNVDDVVDYIFDKIEKN